MSTQMIHRSSAKASEHAPILTRLSVRKERTPLVRELMSTDVLVCQRTDSCADVAARMRDGNVGMLPVLDGRDLVGVVTDRDIAVRHVPAEAKGKHHADVGSCMTPSVVSVPSSIHLATALRTMREHQLRRLLVVDQGTLQGVLTLDDILLEKGTPSETRHVLEEAMTGTRGPERP